VKFSVFKEHQEAMGNQLGAIRQDVQAMGNQIDTMNQGMEDLSNRHNTPNKQCETEFEKMSNDFGNTTMTVGQVNKAFDDLSTRVQVIRDNQ
jgi:archaellum component FlaC